MLKGRRRKRERKTGFVITTPKREVKRCRESNVSEEFERFWTQVTDELGTMRKEEVEMVVDANIRDAQDAVL